MFLTPADETALLALFEGSFDPVAWERLRQIYVRLNRRRAVRQHCDEIAFRAGPTKEPAR